MRRDRGRAAPRPAWQRRARVVPRREVGPVKARLAAVAATVALLIGGVVVASSPAGAASTVSFTQVASTTGVTGTTASATASVTGDVTSTVTGTVTYTLFTGASCSGTALATSTAQSVTADGNTFPTYAPQNALGAGMYSFQAAFSGDANGNTAGSNCQSFTVLPSGAGTVTFSNLSVVDAATGKGWTGLETTGASAADTVTVNGAPGVPPTGIVTASLYPTPNCTGTALQVVPITLANGTGQSAASPPLGAANYSYQDVYGGDTNYAGGAVSSCLLFKVGKGTPTVAATVYDAATNAAWPANPSPDTGARAYDTATVAQASGVSGFTPSGTVTYEFFTLGAGAPCSGSPNSTQTVSLSGGNVPVSATTGALGRGSYAFEALYGGDANWTPPAGACETFNVSIGTPSTPTISNLPGGATEFDSFTASVSTDGDGQTSVTSNTTGVCTVGPDGRTVTFVLYGTCSLTAFVGAGTNYGAGAGAPQVFTIKAAARGYWLVGSDGGIFSFGAAQFHGSMGGIPLQRPVVGLTPTAARIGYWLVASDGGVFSFGDSTFYGSLPGLGLHPAGSGMPHSLNQPVVGIVPSITQHGYFMVASDGGVFAFGDAHFAGSCPGVGGCAGAAVAVIPDSTGNGYWLVTDVGDVYAFGDAPYYGNAPTGGSPAVDAVATPDGHGYWILLSDGTVDSFGDAAPLGAPLGYVNGFNPATAIFPTADGHGYWVTAARGDVFSYGNAPFLGGMSATDLNGPIIAGYGF
jgi:hypothetical protein